MDTPEFKIDTSPSRQQVRFLEDRINEYNYEATGITDGLEIAIFIRDEKGEIRAGLYGWTWGGTCEIASLWVNRDLRGQGLGSQLLRAAEAEARARGATQIVLDTHSFQAPEFYKRFGFEVVGLVENYPRGHQHIFMCKLLGPVVKRDAD